VAQARPRFKLYTRGGNKEIATIGQLPLAGSGGSCLPKHSGSGGRECVS